MLGSDVIAPAAGIGIEWMGGQGRKPAFRWLSLLDRRESKGDSLGCPGLMALSEADGSTLRLKVYPRLRTLPKAEGSTQG